MDAAHHLFQAINYLTSRSNNVLPGHCRAPHSDSAHTMVPVGRIRSEKGVKVLLVGNYANDGQESMLRFTGLLALQLAARGIRVECLSPSSVFGRLHPGVSGAGKWLAYLDKFLLFPRQLRNRVRQLDSEWLVHICDHSNAVYTRALAGVPHLVTCHDLLAVRSALGEFPGRGVRASGRFYQWWILRGLNAAQRVACISTATRRDLLRLSTLEPPQVTLIHNGLNHSYAPLPAVENASRLREAAMRLGGGSADAKLQAGFILHVGGNQWYKNRSGVIQIYARLCEKTSHPPNLVMVGKPFTPQMRRNISTHRLEDRVIELNTVSNEDLRTLYCAAQLLLFPSWEEGFGWPIIEAQACGCRVVIADREPMTEIGGDAAAYLKLERPIEPGPDDASLSIRAADNAANSVMEILQETGAERMERVQKGLRNAARFTTGRMVESYVDLYRQMRSAGAEPHPRASEPISVR